MSASKVSSTQRRWEAVVDRSATADDFVYAVTTTGVYCRASCPSRRPKRDNVVFFDGALAAEQGGFRPCKRCRPDRAVVDAHAPVVEGACRALETEEPEPTLERLSRAAGMSPFHFQRVFKRRLGLSPKAYAKAARGTRLARALGARGTVTDAIYDAGFAAPSRAYEAASSRLGMTPGRWRDGAPGEAVRYAIAPCHLGRVLVAGTARGLCTIELGDDPGALLDVLRERFPGAELSPADRAFEGWLELVLRFLETPSEGLQLPLDIQGTAFQERVWRALLRVEPGTTVSYAELARLIGQPGAARAVAGACASNRLAVAVPCHRVVRADGALSGYRWGPERKASLLAREARVVEPGVAGES